MKSVNGIDIPYLPPNYAESCLELQEIKGTSAQENLFWSLDTIAKYNDCAIKKEAVSEAYNLLVQKLMQK